MGRERDPRTSARHARSQARCDARSTAPRTALAGLLLTGLAAGVTAASTTATATTGPPTTSRSEAPCLSAGLRGAAPAKATEATRDPSLWLDECGHGLYVEPARPATARTRTPARPVGVPLAETFLLESRPGATRTVHLDFRGGPLTGTVWNAAYGDPLRPAPYSITAPASTEFTDQELRRIQLAWAVVAEDYAPFDVNVTTRDLGVAALDRPDRSDPEYGIRVVITGAGPVQRDCGCGGIAYASWFGYASPERQRYQPAWVFTRGTGLSGQAIGLAASHEVGHTLGLRHHGTWLSEYAAGRGAWGPVMGAAYARPVTQWSRGDYGAASNPGQDDLATIAGQLPVVPDDHPADPALATPLAVEQPVAGLISTAGDVDAFALTLSGPAAVTVLPDAPVPNLDLRLRILDEAGRPLAAVDPRARRLTAGAAVGLGAAWRGTLPPGRYTALVDGVGTGDPSRGGRYTDYGSLGRFVVTLHAEPPPSAAVPVLPGRTIRVPAGRRATRLLGVRTDHPGPLAWSASPPPGLRLSPGGVLTADRLAPGRYRFPVTLISRVTSTRGHLVVVVRR